MYAKLEITLEKYKRINYLKASGDETSQFSIKSGINSVSELAECHSGKMCKKVYINSIPSYKLRHVEITVKINGKTMLEAIKAKEINCSRYYQKRSDR